jgi:hypothetical protein
VAKNAVPVLVVLVDDPVLTVVTPVCKVVSTTGGVVVLIVDILVEVMEVKTVVDVPAVLPVTMVVTVVVPLTTGLFVVAEIVETAVVVNVEVVLVELVEACNDVTVAEVLIKTPTMNVAEAESPYVVPVTVIVYMPPGTLPT